VQNTANAKSFLAIDYTDMGREIELFETGYPKAQSLASDFDGNLPQSDQQDP
jgi:hypothetical protein